MGCPFDARIKKKEMVEKDAYWNLKYEIFKVYKDEVNKVFIIPIIIIDQKIQKLPRAAEVRCSDGRSAEDLPSGNSKNNEESYGHKLEEQEITERMIS